MCKVVDAMGSAERSDFCERFFTIQYHDYEDIFGPSRPSANIDQIKNRFKWFQKYVLQRYNLS